MNLKNFAKLVFNSASYFCSSSFSSYYYVFLFFIIIIIIVLHFSSSYYDLSLRLSMDDNINLSSGGSPYGLKDYTFTDAQTFATASNFQTELHFLMLKTDRKVLYLRLALQPKQIKLE